MRTHIGSRRRGADAATLLFGSTRRRVLGWLLGHSDQAFYVRQIVRQTGVGAGTVHRELEQLTAAGLLRRTVQGRQVYFQANRDASIFPELQGLFAKTAGLTDVLTEALAPFGARVLVAFVFGSGARGTLSASSDIDLFVVGQVEFSDVVKALATAQARLGRDVNPTVYPPAEVRRKLRAKHHFLMAVLGGPRMFVIGGDDELARLGTKRVGDQARDQPRRNPRPAASGRTRSRRQRR